MKKNFYKRYWETNPDKTLSWLRFIYYITVAFMTFIVLLINVFFRPDTLIDIESRLFYLFVILGFGVLDCVIFCFAVFFRGFAKMIKEGLK